jgi:hypothetical protein
MILWELERVESLTRKHVPATPPCKGLIPWSFHNLDYGPRIAPMDGVTEFISWQRIQLRVRTT